MHQHAVLNITAYVTLTIFFFYNTDKHLVGKLPDCDSSRYSQTRTADMVSW